MERVEMGVGWMWVLRIECLMPLWCCSQVNEKLRPEGIGVSDVRRDFRDGQKLCILMRLLTRKALHGRVRLGWNFFCNFNFICVWISSLGMIVLSAVQSSQSTLIHNVINNFVYWHLNNVWYNKIHLLIGKPYLTIIAININLYVILVLIENSTPPLI